MIMLLIGFVLFITVVIPTFTLGLVVLKGVVSFTWLVVQVVCMWVWEFIFKPIFSRIKRIGFS